MQSKWQGWVPFRLRARDETVDCRWFYCGEKRFAEPFFEETIRRCLSLPENSFSPARFTALDEVQDIARDVDALEPSAFIFHVSRCGSTLVTQLLGLSETCVTLSEVPFFDQLLRARFQPPMREAVDVATHLPAAIRLHGRKRSAAERFLVVKLDSWHVAFHAELRALYPQTPFILLYREPRAVMRSQRKLPGMHAVPRMIEDAVFGFDGARSGEAHLSRVLAFYYRTFVKIARDDPRSLLIRYETDMIPAVEAIAKFCGIDISAAHREQMRARTVFHAKHATEPFRKTEPEVDADQIGEDCLAAYKSLERFASERASNSRYDS